MDPEPRLPGAGALPREYAEPEPAPVDKAEEPANSPAPLRSLPHMMSNDHRQNDYFMHYSVETRLTRLNGQAGCRRKALLLAAPTPKMAMTKR